MKFPPGHRSLTPAEATACQTLINGGAHCPCCDAWWKDELVDSILEVHLYHDDDCALMLWNLNQGQQ